MAWNQGKGTNQVRPQKNPSPMRGILAGGAVIVLAAGAYLFLSSDAKNESKQDVEGKNSSLIKEVSPATAPKAPDEEGKVEPDVKKRKSSVNVMKMTPEQREAYIVQKAKETPIDLKPSSNVVFKTGTEQLLSWIFSRQLGDAPPPLPQISIHDEAHLTEILMNTVPPESGDSEQVRLAKEMVDAAKKELRQFIKNGGNIQEFVSYYRDKLIQAHNEWKDCQQALMKVAREEPGIFHEYRDEVNKRLSEKGIKSVDIPPMVKKHYGINEN